MARVQVVCDDGRVVLDELALASQLTDEHYRRCLADRIAWAVADAEVAPGADAHDVPLATA